MSRLAKPRFLIVYVLAVCFFLIARITEVHLRWGIFFVVLGESLRFWANGYVGHVKVNRTAETGKNPKAGQLVTAGPYAFVRNPLYLGSFIIGLGFCVIVGQIWFLVAALGTFLIVYRRKIVEEEDVLFHEWGEAFKRYQDAVPRLFPTWKRYHEAQGKWSWRGIAASKEWKTVLWAAVFMILIYFWEEVVQERESLFNEKPVLRACLLGIVVILMMTDGFFELLKRRLKCSARVE